MVAHLGIIVVTSVQRIYLFVEKGSPSSLPLAWQAVATLPLVILSVPMSQALDAARTLPVPECILEAEIASSGQQGGQFSHSSPNQGPFPSPWTWVDLGISFYLIFPTTPRMGHFNWAHFSDRKTEPPSGKLFALDSGCAWAQAVSGDCYGRKKDEVNGDSTHNLLGSYQLS